MKILQCQLIISVMTVLTLASPYSGEAVAQASSDTTQTTSTIQQPLPPAAAPEAPTQIEGAPSVDGAQWNNAAIRIAAIVIWPVTLITAILLFAYNKRLGQLLSNSANRLQRIKAVGVELEFKPQVANEVRSDFREWSSVFVAKAREEYDTMATGFSVHERLAEIVRTALPRALAKHGVVTPPIDYRVTIHVPDVIFSDYLYQLVDYYPYRSGTAGRRFSQRFGIIGRCWRLRESLGEGDAMHQTEGADRERALVALWGMTREEAHTASRARPAYLSTMLRDNDGGNVAVGVLFIDSGERNMFGDEQVATKVAQTLEMEPEVMSLAAALATGLRRLRVGALKIDIGLATK